MSEWISVKDRLPDVIGHYIIYQEIYKSMSWVFLNSDKKWCAQNMFYEDVTHWMALPGPPKDTQ